MNGPIKNWRETKKLHHFLGKIGKIATHTRIFVPPLGFEKEASYIVAVVEFDNGQRLTVQVVDCSESDLHTGQKVITVVRRVGSVTPEGVIDYGIKVKPC